MATALRIGGALAAVVAVAIGGYLVAFYAGWLGEPPGPGRIEGAALPEAPVIARQEAAAEAAAELGVEDAGRILFGDLHVHTTYSTDAFLWSLPMNGGTGLRPVGSACDFARYCSQLDFWAVTDHAESLTPRKWEETKRSIRQCQAAAGEGASPDLVSMLGFEWTQVGATPEEHYGHKNVIFRGLEDEELAARPIGAAGFVTDVLRSGGDLSVPPIVILVEPGEPGPYFDLNAFLAEARAVPACDPGADPKELPPDCYEQAETPGELVRRLEAQGLAPLLIPHGTTWGFYTPPGSTLDPQLEPGMRPDAFPLVEVYSGHGSSEEYRPWRAVEGTLDGVSATCPEPGESYTPSCWRAGEIVAERCREAGESEATCAERAADARSDYANMGIAGHLAITGESAAEWLDAGQCTDCFLPAFNYRPGGSVQYGLAISDFSKGRERPRRFRWGFVASSDNHRARPGTGYKEADRRLDTEAGGPVSEAWRRRITPDEPERAESVFREREELRALAGYQLAEMERQSSFWLTGGLAAVHAEGRSREAVWEALQRRETYATSGPRILLWFDHLGAEEVDGARGSVTPMGGRVASGEAPRFRVRAMGAFVQKPGCPEFVHEGLAPSRIRRICSGECYHPSDERHRIVRIEVVRIRPQVRPGEPVAALVDDPFRVHACPAEGEGCRFTFEDPDFPAAGRDALYYVRAVQEATPTINAEGLRCRYDEEGRCVEVDPCYGDYRTPRDEACRAPAEHRAWSSPIRVEWRPAESPEGSAAGAEAARAGAPEPLSRDG